MKFKLLFTTLFLMITSATQSQNLDSVRKVIKSMKFDVPVISPMPTSVRGAKETSISLNGIWKFNFDNEDLTTVKNIEVPGEWEMQGFKVEKGRSAVYRTTFSIPGDWQGNIVKLRFDGVSSWCLVSVNGHPVGTHEGSFVMFEFDITGAVNQGENLLEVEVRSQTISDILACTSQYAAHTVGGILRKVTLFTLPEINIADFSWNVKFDINYQDAFLNVTGRIKSEKSIKKNTFLQFTLSDENNQYVKLGKNRFEVPAGKNTGNINCTLHVRKPRKWDPEHPNLYLLTTSLITDGKVLQTNRQKIGFRQIELHGNQFYVNNFPVKLRGVDRHEIHPLRGRSLTPMLCRRDAELFRAGNCNYIRTSHYPPSEEFLEACDELGMFVESEASLCWIQHGASPIWKEWNYLDTQYLPYMLRSNFDNVLSGRQHPCIIVWSLGNESRWSPLWEKVNGEIKKLDPSRPTSFHDQCWGNFNNAASSADLANYHYPSFNGPRECEKDKTRPTLFGEYMHVQCYARRELETDPSVRSDTWAKTLKQMVDSVYKYPACLGGAIWSGIDDIFHLSSEKICGYGPWGPIDGWRREKPEYTGMKKSYSPVIITNLQSVKADNGKVVLEIENRYNFTNLSELKIEAKAGNHTISVKADIPPLSKGFVSVDMTGKSDDNILKLTFTDGRGFICQEEALQIRESPAPAGSKDRIPLTLSEKNGIFFIQTGKKIYSVNKSTGSIGCMTSAGDSVFANSGVLMLVPFNNDDGGAPNIAGNNYTQDIQPLEYKPVENLNIKSFQCLKNTDGAVEVNMSASTEDKLEGKQTYLFNNDGTVTISYDYKALTDFTKKNLLRQFGLLFTLPVKFDLLSWERKGLWTIYPEYDINRLKGSAKALPRNLKYVEIPREIPSDEWKDNSNKLGTNDFRSTKDNIIRAALKNDRGIELTVHSDGTQSARSWIDGDKTRFLVAGLSGPGSCGFFTGPRPEIKKGEHLAGKFTLDVN